MDVVIAVQFSFIGNSSSLWPQSIKEPRVPQAKLQGAATLLRCWEVEQAFVRWSFWFSVWRALFAYNPYKINLQLQ